MALSELMEKFYEFAHNHAQGSSPETRNRRWHEFIIQAHKQSAPINPETIAGTLEDGGIPDLLANQYVKDYLTGRAILKLYDEA